MKAKTVKKLIQNIQEQRKVGYDWLNNINYQIRTVFFDNSYTESLHKQVDLLMRATFKDIYEEVYWFIMDWREGFTITNKDGKDYIINNLDDFIQYLSEEGLVT